LSDSEDSHLAALPSPMLLQKEREQHEEPTIMNDPPNIDAA
jgi:hypothetical protein